MKWYSSLFVTLAAVVILFGSALPGAHAAGVKVDVCHSEGNGSFHLINISDKAVPAHRNHGDALPGEGVPGAPGTDFDEFCDQVLASTCPCDYSATGLAQVGIDGSEDDQCIAGQFGILVLGGGGTGSAREMFGDGLFSTHTCERQNSSGAAFEFFSGLTDEQRADCRFDLLQTDACQQP